MASWAERSSSEEGPEQATRPAKRAGLDPLYDQTWSDAAKRSRSGPGHRRCRKILSKAGALSFSPLAEMDWQLVHPARSKAELREVQSWARDDEALSAVRWTGLFRERPSRTQFERGGARKAPRDAVRTGSGPLHGQIWSDAAKRSRSGPLQPKQIINPAIFVDHDPSPSKRSPRPRNRSYTSRPCCRHALRRTGRARDQDREQARRW